MPSDDGHKQTDKELKDLEKRLTKEYQNATKDLEKKFNGYMKDFARKDESMRKLVDSGKMSEDDYLNWRRNQLLVGERWKDMYDTLAKDLANVDQIAAGMINETLPSVYALNMNYGTYEVEKGCRIDTGFNLYSRETVENMMKNEPNIIPHLTERQKARIVKDELWNRQKLVSAVTQGVLQGESISKVANRLQSVANMDRNAAIRNARTYTTAAQNKGRMDSYERMDKLGIQVGKKWIATLDDRTRVEHRHLDGMVVPYKDMFEVDGYEIMFPGDPSAEPEMIYNCRCTLVSEIPGIQYNDERYDEKLGDMTYEEWKHAKDRNPVELPKEEKRITKPEIPELDDVAIESTESMEPEKSERQVVQGEDISLTWQRRKDEFDFEIEDIINAQGFDGLPKIVSGEEFDKAVKESNFIAQRTYSAVDSETLSAYQDSLYNGKWYVDCSVGGSAHGKGMYSAASYDGELNDEIKQEMKDYIGQNESYTSEDAPYIIETFTVDPSARFLELPQKIDDEDYVNTLFSNHVIQGLGEKYGVSEKANELISVTEEKLQNEILFMQGKITESEYGDIVTGLNDKLWELRHSDELKEVMDNYGKIAFKVHDIGEQAALMGYDGLHTHYGTCGNDTIILNRTKLIFKGGK